jgi:hypothetical protein
MKTQKIFIIICLLCCFACNQPKQPVVYERTSYFIDLDSIKRQGVIKTSDMFKKLNVIILEKHEYAVIGGMDSFDIFDNQIFIADCYSVGKLFVFDKTTGKYLRQIGVKGEGPGEYQSLRDFCIDRENKEIYLLDGETERIHKYNIETGKHIITISIPKDVSYRYMALNSGKLYVNTMHWYQNKNDNRIMELDLKTGEHKYHISGNKYNLGWNEPSYTIWNFFASKDMPLKYVEEYMNTIFAIDKDTIYPYLTIKHKDWTPKEFVDAIVNRFDNPLEGHHFVAASSENFVRLLHSYVECDDYIYFEYMQDTYYSVLYDKKTGKTHHYENFLNDLLETKNNMTTHFLYVNSEAAYDYICPHRVNWYQDPELEFAPNLDKREEVIKALASDDEPIIIFEYVFK